MFSTPKLEAVIKQNISNPFVLNSKIGGSYAIYRIYRIFPTPPKLEAVTE